ncbi:DUF2069 domain-containing protein [Azoarcus sp. TTM-91]|uniref:DUF2069 domain-containing protein n=1 Tax=Azoarcus sp. TTM-91 TaxID=2691581 RepID=UPI00145EA9FD|nr:DUF2069 domain-containing protein [Azoarcus sp. TTM-91]NMG33604.1 DUF2069 domain-containing protein [Azoarcus sp. TTM-91]
MSGGEVTVRRLWLLASASLIALIVLCVLWEGWLAPLRPGGSWMTLKALPLMGALFGILRGRRYTYQWLSMLSLLYFTEGVMRAADAAPGGALALAEVALSVVLFCSTVAYARLTAPSRRSTRG